MYIDYDDITSRIVDEPTWWLSGVPRYVPFHPTVATVYADEIALIRSRCQVCHRTFDVAAFRGEISIRDQIVLYGEPRVGDPPSHDNDCGGSMTSEQVELLEYWQREDHKWRRVPEFEGPLADADDPSAAPKSMMQLVWAAQSKPQYDEAWRSENQLEMANILSAAGLERAEYYARLLFAKKRAEAFRRLINEEFSFTRKR